MYEQGLGISLPLLDVRFFFAQDFSYSGNKRNQRMTKAIVVCSYCDFRPSKLFLNNGSVYLTRSIFEYKVMRIK